MIASDCNGNREQIESGVDGTVSTPEDIKVYRRTYYGSEEAPIWKCARERNKQKTRYETTELTMMEWGEVGRRGKEGLNYLAAEEANKIGARFIESLNN